MDNSNRRWPTPEQELLIKASLLDDDAAFSAWQAWRSAVNFDDIDHESFRLLPLVSRAVDGWEQRESTHGDISGRVKGAARLAWSKNQVLFHAMGQVLQQLQDSQIAFLVVGDAALISLYYPGAEQRQVDNFEILIRPAQRQTVLKVVGDLGWQPVGYIPAWQYPLRNGVICRKGSDQLTLRWFAFDASCAPEIDALLRSDGILFDLKPNLMTRTLNPADQLLRCCAERYAPDGPMPSLAIVDSAMLLKSAGSELDVERLLAQATQRHLVLPLRSMLRYLRDTLGINVHDGLTSRLEALPVSQFEYAEFHAYDQGQRLTRLQANWFRYRRYSGPTVGNQQVRGFIAYLAVWWHLPSKVHVVIYVLILLVVGFVEPPADFSRIAGYVTRRNK